MANPFGFIVRAELSLKTKEGKTPNCADCDHPAYFRFSNTRMPNFGWRKCARHMTDEERLAVKCLVIELGNLHL